MYSLNTFFEGSNFLSEDETIFHGFKESDLGPTVLLWLFLWKVGREISLLYMWWSENFYIVLIGLNKKFWSITHFRKLQFWISMQFMIIKHYSEWFVFAQLICTYEFSCLWFVDKLLQYITIDRILHNMEQNIFM